MDAVAEHRESDALEIAPEALTSAVAAALIDSLNVELSARYPEPGAAHFHLDPEEVAPGTGIFGVTRDERLPGKGAVNHGYLVATPPNDR